MINYHNIVFPFLHRHGCRQEADSNFRDFARTSQIKSSIRQSRSLRINNKSWKTNSFQVNFKDKSSLKIFSVIQFRRFLQGRDSGDSRDSPFFSHTRARDTIRWKMSFPMTPKRKNNSPKAPNLISPCLPFHRMTYGRSC